VFICPHLRFKNPTSKTLPKIKLKINIFLHGAGLIKAGVSGNLMVVGIILLYNGMVAKIKFSQPSHYPIYTTATPGQSQGVAAIF
jgi:hypothetical protein